MPSTENFVPLPGSERTPVSHAHSMEISSSGAQIEITVRLRGRASFPDYIKDKLDIPFPQDRTYLTRQEFEQRFGADPADIQKVEAFASAYSLSIVESDPARRVVVLSGTSGHLNAAFHVELMQFTSPRGGYHSYSGPVQIPVDLSGIVLGVLGLDNRPQAVRCPRPQAAAQSPTPSPAASYTPPQLAELYNFPAGLDGRGQCVAILELGGGFLPDDLQNYFSELKLPLPKVSSVSVHGIKNDPTGPDKDDDGEVGGDIETIGGIAPGAEIVVYFAPNSERGFYDAVSKAVHDSSFNPSIISISWGDSESVWATLTRQLFDEVLQVAAALGVTVCCSSGDLGSTNGASDGLQHVLFPASSPFALGCGGTSIVCAGNKIVQETVWNQTDPASGAHSNSGGGVSDVYPVPDWQKVAAAPTSADPDHHSGRGVPDVAGNAEGYQILVNGKHSVGGGTSAVAPLWSGLIARLNQGLGVSVGFLNPFLYREYKQLIQAGAIHEITQGNNGAYSAQKGWNACTGLGTPDGSKLAAALAVKAAGKVAGR
jgi:kumamolisin